MRGFELAQPASLREAIGMLDTEDTSVRPMAGGTALMLMMKSGVFVPSVLVHLGGIEKRYREIAATPEGGLRIGAMATLTSIEHAPEVARIAPVIPKAMKHLSNVRVRNVACIGGNLAHGDPHMDMPPILSALGAEVATEGPQGQRRIAIEGLFSGYYETVLTPGELITEVIVPPQQGWRTAYFKCTTRSYDDWPALGVAVSLRTEGKVVRDVRMMVSAATEKLTRLGSAEAALKGREAGEQAFAQAAEAAASEAETVDDARGSAAYKSQLLRVYTKRALREASS
jgi:carbon-monoxide dehydrogenase medium subunit